MSKTMKEGQTKIYSALNQSGHLTIKPWENKLHSRTGPALMQSGLQCYDLYVSVSIGSGNSFPRVKFVPAQIWITKISLLLNRQNLGGGDFNVYTVYSFKRKPF